MNYVYGVHTPDTVGIDTVSMNQAIPSLNKKGLWLIKQRFLIGLDFINSHVSCLSLMLLFDVHFQFTLWPWKKNLHFKLILLKFLIREHGVKGLGLRFCPTRSNTPFFLSSIFINFETPLFPLIFYLPCFDLCFEGLDDPKHFHHLIAQMIDYFDCNAAGGGFVEGARCVAV